MKYYELSRGDYIQSGDEYQDKNSDWRPATDKFFGLKYGYDPDNQTKPRAWPPMRRLVPDDFSLSRPRTISVPIQEFWGEEFEV